MKRAVVFFTTLILSVAGFMPAINGFAQGPPVFDEVAPQTAWENGTLTFQVHAVDPDEDEISFSHSFVLPTLTVTPSEEGYADVTFSPDFTQAGTYVLTVIASDGVLEDTLYVDITVINVNQPPYFATIGTRQVNEGSTLDFAVSAFDGDGDSLTLTAEDAPPNAAFVDHGDGTGTFTFTPDYAQAGQYEVVFRAADDSVSVTMPVTIDVLNVNGPPQLLPIADRSVRIGNELGFIVTATDPDGTIPVLFARSLPPLASFIDNENGSGQFAFSPEGAAPVDYVVWFVASDGLAADSQAVTISVLKKPPEFTDTVYVAKSGADTAGAGTLDAPYLTIQYALDHSAEGYVILVAPGEYHEAVTFDQWPVKLCSTDGPDSTIIDGQGRGTPVTFPPLPSTGVGSGEEQLNSILDGFTITCPSCTGTPTGGVTIAGGVAIAGGEPVIRNNKIINNRLDTTAAIPSLGGGIYVVSSSPVIYNNIIAGNVADIGGGIYIADFAHLTMVNNTIAHNANRYSAFGSGIHITFYGGINFKNGIIASNRVGWGVYSESVMSAKIAYSLFHDNDGGEYSTTGLTIGEQVGIADPGLIDPIAGDYHLICRAAAFNAGDLHAIDSLSKTDLEGNVRVAYLKPDLGALEFLDQNKQAAFSASDTAGCDFLTVDFLNTSTCIDEQWHWDFGDGGTSSEKNPTHHYISPGIYDVTLVASGDLSADTLVRSGYIGVYTDLAADFVADTSGGCVPLSISFSGVIEGIVQEYRWDFGDGIISSDPSPTHVYNIAGNHTVSLTVSSPCDTVTVIKPEMIVTRAKPQVEMTSSHDADSLVTGPLCNPLTVRFYTVSDDSLTSYEWDFADNTQADERNPVHVYESGGTYSVRLIATGPCGSTTVVRYDYITVLDRPTVTPLPDRLDGCVPLTVNFDATATGTIDSYLWDFGDGETAPGRAVAHTYTDIDTFAVRLIVTHGCGADTIPVAAPIVSRDRPVVDFSCPVDIQYVSDTVQFVDRSTNLPTEWSWDFGDSGTADLANPTHVYQAPGIYTISLRAANGCGVGSPVQKAACVTVAGYELFIGGGTPSGDTISYPLIVDSILALYPNLIYLEATTQPAPDRGTLSVMFSDTAVQPPFTGDLLLVPSIDLSTGLYTVSVSAVDSVFGHQEIETILYEHQGRMFIALQPDTLDFDSVVVNTTRHVPVRILNTSPTELLTVRSVTAAGEGFSAPTVEDIPIHPDSSITFSVSFLPRKRTTYTGELRVRTDDPAVRDTAIALVGRGIPEQNAPTVITSWPVPGADNILISDSVVVEFSEPVEVEEADTTVVISSRRLGWRLEGRLESSERSVTFFGNDYWPPLDTLDVRLVADRVYDSVYNRVDGDEDGLEEGSPDDDYLFLFITGPGVYPGDTDDDREVDERDVLPIGRFWLQTGPARPSRYEDFSIQPAYIWPDMAATYADADGDGIIDSLDVCPILEFWSGAQQARPADQQKFLEEIGALNMAIVRAIYSAIDYCPETTAAASLKSILSGWIEQESTGPPTVCELYQNYPNPFNARTVITYTLPAAAEVELIVFNAAGEKVTVLEQGRKSAGRHVAIWNGRTAHGLGAASGIYFFRLSAGEFRQTRKMVLMK